MMTSSAKRTLTGLVFNLAFLAALMNADLGDFWKEGKGNKRSLKDNQLVSIRVMYFCFSSTQVKIMFPSGKQVSFFSTQVLMR